MSREGIIAQLQMRGILADELIYAQAEVSVYKGRIQAYPAAVKVLHLTATSDYHILERECEQMKSLSHPNIVKLYDCFWVNNADHYYFIVVVEWCDKDLGKDIKLRSQNSYVWPEHELLSLTRSLVSALAYMQTCGIAHRDIKPENIFLTFDRTVKLGDFGSSKPIVNMQDTQTLAGTPYYLSPVLKESLLCRNPEVVHNVFKSDVYSLGLTLLSLALLRVPVELMNINTSDTEAYRVVNSITYSEDYKRLLMLMLRSDESSRYDFLQLEFYSTPRASIVTPIVTPQKTQKDIYCLDCGKLVDLFRVDAMCEVVQLYCNPSQHMFCSRNCCSNYLRFKRMCPQCNVEIDCNTRDFYARAQETYQERDNSSTTPSLQPEFIQRSLYRHPCDWCLDIDRCSLL